MSATNGKDADLIYTYLAKRSNALEKQLIEACSDINKPKAAETLDELLDANHVKQVSEKLLTDYQSDTVPTYMLSSLTIQEACDSLTRTRFEDMRFATGMAVQPLIFAITRLLQFELKRQSAVFAEGNQESVAKLLIGLHNANHKLYMTWHSHPGNSKESTDPSSTDLDFHRRLEAGDYPVIGGIVNREGYVRFFSYKRRFKISIYGNGLEVINEQSKLYKLCKCGAI